MSVGLQLTIIFIINIKDDVFRLLVMSVSQSSSTAYP